MGKKHIPSKAATQSATSAKVPVQSIRPGNNPIVFSFKHFDQSPPWASRHCTGKERNICKSGNFHEIAKKISNYETMTWNDIDRNPKRDHAVDIIDLTSEARKRFEDQLPNFIDEESLYRLRFNSIQRLWGIRRGDIFYIVWWDPQHEACPSKLKGT